MADMAEKDKRWRSSGDKFSGCVSASYLDERFDENVEERRLLLVRSRSLTRECDFLSGELGGVPCVCELVLWARAGVAASLDFFDGDLVKMEGRTMGGDLGKAWCNWILGPAACCSLVERRFCKIFWDSVLENGF